MAPSSSSSSSSSAAASATTSAAATLTVPGNLKIVGIILAISSGLLIGSSFVFKKKGLLRSQKGLPAGEGVAYLKSPLWWIGMTMMILGEICNFVAYAFVEAIVVTPMGALSVVICAILSSIFLNEKLSFFGWLGCGLCIVGSVIIALNGPQEATVGQIVQFQKLFLSPGFLVYGSILITAAVVIALYFAPRYGKDSMMWYIMICSMIGGISVSVTTGLGSAIVTTAMGDNQFKHWFIYFLMAFVAITLVTEVYYLNVALALFNTAMVTPTYYVIFTFFSMLTTIVLFKGLNEPATSIITLVMGFVVICFGITILQLSKVDPTQIKHLDRRSTILLQAARNQTENMDEKSLTAVEDPGMDALRGTFGMVGSVIRAKSARRMSMSSSSVRSRYSAQPPLPPLPSPDPLVGLKRHQLYDAPMPSTPEFFPRDQDADSEIRSYMSSPRSRKQTIKFNDQELVHSYYTPGTGANTATHEQRSASHGTPSLIPIDADIKGDSDAQVVTLPVTETLDSIDEETGMRTAPPMVGGTDPYHHPALFDHFANSPSTAVGGSFTRRDSTPKRGRRGSESGSGTHTPPQHHPLHLWSRSPRSPSGSRRYPSRQIEEDREESESLWNRTSEESDGDDRGGVRLVGGGDSRQ
ncbi:magnesium transporter NIPA-domain-containing protein [Amylocystis lapponica]|nr:magnesium transporter NIPA-domain-containing protein [Amylocystis lapponica]